MISHTYTGLILLIGKKIGLIDPGQFRVLNDLLQTELKGRARLETLNLSASRGEERIE